MISYPDLLEVEQHCSAMGAALRAVGVPSKTISSIRTKALRTGRKITGEHATNRHSRWSLAHDHPQYGTELACKIIFVKLAAQVFSFDNAPPFPASLSHVPGNIKDLASALQSILQDCYLDAKIEPNSYCDSLLLEHFDFNDLVNEGLNPVHGHSSFHIGHENPLLTPKHIPSNVSWRTFRSNLIQGNMTLRQARIYFVKLIARYFELGEIEISGEADATSIAALPDPSIVAPTNSAVVT